MKTINFIYLTSFPSYFESYFEISLAKKAREKGLINYQIYNLRDFADKGKIDDYPYGGGCGMVLKIFPLVHALSVIQEKYFNSYLILLSPQGKKFSQLDVSRIINKSHNLVFICGHYEGFDERILNYVDEQISLGDFITMSGEIPALMIADALIRAIPGVIKKQSYEKESFNNGKNLDFASYTKPRIFDNQKVPEILLSGDHKKINNWRLNNTKEKTLEREKKFTNHKKIVLNPNNWRLSKNKKT